MARSRMSWLMAAGAVALVVGCHTITEEAPTEPTEVPKEPNLATITIPLILPAANPTPSPAPTPVSPTPAPTPTPEPTPTPPPGGGSCNLPAGDPDAGCSRTSPTFLGDVESAIDSVIDKNPNLFDKNDKVCGTCYRIKDHTAYVEAVASQMRAMGYCAFYDGEELAVKNTNSFSEQYDISTSRGYVRRGEGSYRATCWPAWF